MWPFRRKKKSPNLIDRYLSLADQGKFREGLPLIKEIVERGPDIATSWFNLGICQAELGWHAKAAEAFLKAYELDPHDGGALYRACLSLDSAKDHRKLFEIMQRECQHDPTMIRRFLEDEQLSRLFSKPEFQKLESRYSSR